MTSLMYDHEIVEFHLLGQKRNLLLCICKSYQRKLIVLAREIIQDSLKVQNEYSKKYYSIV